MYHLRGIKVQTLSNYIFIDFSSSSSIPNSNRSYMKMWKCQNHPQFKKNDLLAKFINLFNKSFQVSI